MHSDGFVRSWAKQQLSVVQVHFAEEWNELHHLQIMESLGGDQYWIDRFMAQHAAVFYYWVLIAFFALFPSLAYMFSELVEVRQLHSSVMLTCFLRILTTATACSWNRQPCFHVHKSMSMWFWWVPNRCANLKLYDGILITYNGLQTVDRSGIGWTFSP